MDICDHPELIPIHGTLLGKNPHVEPLTPLFTLSKTTLHADILGVPVEQYTDILRRIAWEEKYEDKLMWRGSNTGAYYSHDIPWRSTHRARLIEMVNADEGELEMLPPPRSLEGATIAEKRRNVSKEVVNRYYADMAFTGEPIRMSCSQRSFRPGALKSQNATSSMALVGSSTTNIDLLRA
jgi:hypothetical protein